MLLDAIPSTLSDTSFNGLAYLLPYSAPGCSQQRSAACSPSSLQARSHINGFRPEIRRFYSIGLCKCVQRHLLQPVPVPIGPSDRWRVLVLLRRQVAVSVIADICRAWKGRI